MFQSEKFEQLWLPLWPLASDDLRAGIYRVARSEALTKRYIEANPAAIFNLLVVDIDHEDALMSCMWDRGDWLPNAVVENPLNGHAHAVWALKAPIPRTEYARRKPLAYAAAVVEGLRRSVDGDRGYSGLITKNPEHPAWEARWLTDHLYTLDELTEHISGFGCMPEKGWRKNLSHADITGLGRNCAIFEQARTITYRLISQCPDRSPRAAKWLENEITRVVAELNTTFTEPLPASEARGIARSISKWVFTKSRMWANGPSEYVQTFTKIQTARGRKSGRARREKNREIFLGEIQ